MYELKNNGKFSIPLEKLNDDVVEYLNSFEDSYLKSFHHDNFLKFEEFGAEMGLENFKKNLKKIVDVIVEKG